MTTTERKTLSIKHKLPGSPFGMMWQAPSNFEALQQSLTQTLKDILILHKTTLTSTYDDRYRLNCNTKKSLKSCLEESYRELQSSMRYQNQTKMIFEKMTQKISESLMDEFGDEANRVNEVVSNLLYPKQPLPKVNLNFPK